MILILDSVILNKILCASEQILDSVFEGTVNKSIKLNAMHILPDGNGRTGRIILYKECLRNSLLPFIIRDDQKAEYYHALQDNSPDELKTFFEKEQGRYFEQLKEFLYVYEKNLDPDRRQDLIL